MLPPHPTGPQYTPCELLLCQINTRYGALGFWFGRGITLPPVDLPILAYYHPNGCFHLTLHVLTTHPVNHFHARYITSPEHLVFRLTGEYSCPLSITRSQLTTTSTDASILPYRSPIHPPSTASMPDRYRVRGTRFLVWQGNTPAPC